MGYSGKLSNNKYIEPLRRIKMIIVKNQGNSAESESGGSVVDSIIGEHNVSGRSSAYGDNIPESLIGVRGDSNIINFQVRCYCT